VRGVNSSKKPQKKEEYETTRVNRHRRVVCAPWMGDISRAKRQKKSVKKGQQRQSEEDSKGKSGQKATLEGAADATAQFNSRERRHTVEHIAGEESGKQRKGGKTRKDRPTEKFAGKKEGRNAWSLREER